MQSLLAEHIAVLWWKLRRIPQLESALCHREDRLVRLEDARAEKSSYENDENEPEQPWVKPRDRRAHRAADQKLREAQAEPTAPLARLIELLERRSATLANFDRYNTSLLRSISKALRELKMQQATRAYPLVPALALANVDDNFEDAASQNEPSEVLQPFETKLDATPADEKSVDVDVEDRVANPDENLRKDPSSAVLPPAYPPVPAPAVANIDKNFEVAASRNEFSVLQPVEGELEATSVEKNVDVDVEHRVENPNESVQNDQSFVLRQPVQVKSGTASSNEKVQFPFFITKSAKAKLRELGFSDREIAKMKPHHARRILGPL